MDGDLQFNGHSIKLPAWAVIPFIVLIGLCVGILPVTRDLLKAVARRAKEVVLVGALLLVPHSKD